MATILSLRMKPGKVVAKQPSQRRPLLMRAYITSDVPPNVQEARDWIAAWKARQTPVGRPHITSKECCKEGPGTSPPPNVQEARDWIAAWKARQVPPAAPTEYNAIEAVVPDAPVDAAPSGSVAAVDGTLFFSKALLDGWSYEDLFRALVAKEKK